MDYRIIIEAGHDQLFSPTSNLSNCSQNLPGCVKNEILEIFLAIVSVRSLYYHIKNTVQQSSSILNVTAIMSLDFVLFASLFMLHEPQIFTGRILKKGIKTQSWLNMAHWCFTL